MEGNLDQEGLFLPEHGIYIIVHGIGSFLNFGLAAVSRNVLIRHARDLCFGLIMLSHHGKLVCT